MTTVTASFVYEMKFANEMCSSPTLNKYACLSLTMLLILLILDSWGNFHRRRKRGGGGGGGGGGQGGQAPQ